MICDERGEEKAGDDRIIPTFSLFHERRCKCSLCRVREREVGFWQQEYLECDTLCQGYQVKLRVLC